MIDYTYKIYKKGFKADENDRTGKRIEQAITNFGYADSDCYVVFADNQILAVQADWCCPHVSKTIEESAQKHIEELQAETQKESN